MRFKYKTEEEIKKGHLIPDGIYEADVFDAFDVDRDGNPLLTRNGQEKIDLICNVYDNNGKAKQLKCALTEAYYKVLKHFCDVNGLEEKFKSETLTAEDCKTNNTFKVEVGSYSFKDKSTGEEIWMNTINDFLSLDYKEPVKKEEVIYNKITGEAFPGHAGDAFNDDVPF